MPMATAGYLTKVGAAWINNFARSWTPSSVTSRRARVHAQRDRRTGSSRPKALQCRLELPQCLVRFGETLKRHLKNPPCNNTWWQEVLRKESPRSVLVTLQGVASPPLLPSVVAGSSVDCIYTGTKGQHLMYYQPSAPRSHEGHIPSIPGGTRGA